jgi:hypothetical protein
MARVKIRPMILGLLCVASGATLVAACSSDTSDPEDAPVPSRTTPGTSKAAVPRESTVIAEFEGFSDPVAGTFMFAPVNDDPSAHVEPKTVALIPSKVTPGGYVSLVAANNTWGGICGTGIQCVEVTMTNFDATNALGNVHSEVFEVVPTSGYTGSNSVPSRLWLNLSNTLGLWDYGALDKAGATGATAMRIWAFNNNPRAPYRFRGRVLANKFSRANLAAWYRADALSVTGAGVGAGTNPLSNVTPGTAGAAVTSLLDQTGDSSRTLTQGTAHISLPFASMALTIRSQTPQRAASPQRRAQRFSWSHRPLRTRRQQRRKRSLVFRHLPEPIRQPASA